MTKKTEVKKLTKMDEELKKKSIKQTRLINSLGNQPSKQRTIKKTQSTI